MSDAEIDSARVAREKAAWNAGVERGLLEDMLGRSSAIWADDVDAVIRTAFLPHAGGRFLEIGSSTWASWIHRLKTRVGSLECINISEAEIESGRRQALNTEVDPVFRVMDAHGLDYKDGVFDVVFGKAIIHHLDYARSLEEISRVLRPGGTMVFMEPLDVNPIGWLVRALTPGMRTPDEVPMRMSHVGIFRRYFDAKFYPVELLTPPVGALTRLISLRQGCLPERIVQRIDRMLVRLPGLRWWSRSVVIVGKKRS